MKKKTLTPLILGGIFFFMLGLSFAAVPLYDLFCRVTGFGGTTQISNEIPKIVLENNLLNDLNIGALLALIASISYGFAANIVQPLIKDYGAIPTLKISLRYATLFSFIMLLPNSDIVLPSISDSLFPILLLGIGSSGIAFVSFYNLINDVGAVAGSITVYIIPIFSTIFGFVFLNEYTNNVQLVGIVIVILSAYRFSKIKN